MPASRPVFTRDDHSAPAEAEEQLSLRQLRHHVGNTWQQILCEVTLAAETGGSEEARRLARQIERRISAAVGVADALFGFTRAPGSLETRLTSLCRHALASQAGCGQSIALDVQLEGDCPPHLAATVLRVAQEMVTNAVKHGLHDRERGRILVHLKARPSGLCLTVSDDGWGLGACQPGEGMALMSGLAAEADGEIGLTREGALTVARLDLP